MAFVRGGFSSNFTGRNCLQHMQPVLNQLKVLLKHILHPSPIGLHDIGFGSFIALPRKIRGRKRISIGKRSFVGSHAWIEAFDSYGGNSFDPQIKIGSGVNIGRYCCITAVDSITIEDECLLSEHIYISDHGHGFSPTQGPPAGQPLYSKGKVRIGAFSFVGYRATILSGVDLGSHCVVGAHAVVTRGFPAYSMIAGVPAVLIKRYSHSEQRWLSVDLEVDDK